MTPAEIQNTIETLNVSRKKQINVEFEGYDPGHDMPQDRQIAELLSQLHAGGHVIIDGDIYSAEAVQDIREKFNGLVKQYMADNPGQKVATELLQKMGTPSRPEVPPDKRRRSNTGTVSHDRHTNTSRPKIRKTISAHHYVG